MSSTAPAKWAQREDTVFLRFDAPDCKDVKVVFEKDSLHFSGVWNGKAVENKIEVFKEIDPEKSGYQVSKFYSFLVNFLLFIL